jgi:hypothetical protein
MPSAVSKESVWSTDKELIYPILHVSMLLQVVSITAQLGFCFLTIICRVKAREACAALEKLQLR